MHVAGPLEPPVAQWTALTQAPQAPPSTVLTFLSHVWGPPPGSPGPHAPGGVGCGETEAGREEGR